MNIMQRGSTALFARRIKLPLPSCFVQILYAMDGAAVCHSASFPCLSKINSQLVPSLPRFGLTPDGNRVYFAHVTSSHTIPRSTLVVFRSCWWLPNRLTWLL